MPKFPRHESERQVTTQQPSFLAAGDSAGVSEEITAKMLAGVQEASVKWLGAVDTIQTTAAKANFKTGMLDILNRAENDPDPNAHEKYFKEIEQLKKNSIKGFASRGAETNARIDLGYEAEVGRISVDNMFKKKMIDVGQASALQLIDTEVNSPSPASFGVVQGILDEQVRAGVFDRTDAFKIYDKAEDDIKQNMFIQDLELDPEVAEQNLKQNAYGFDVDKLDKARSILSRRKKKNEEAQEEANAQLVSDFGQRLADNQLTLDDVQTAVMNGQIDAKTAVAYELALAGPKKWREFESESEQGAKSKLMTSLLEKGTTAKERKQVVLSAIENYNNGKLNVEDMAFILRVANGKTIDSENPIWGFLKSAVKSLGGSASIAFNAMEKFKRRWDMKSDPREVMQEAKIDTQKEQNPETASYKVGDVISRKGRSATVVGFDADGKPRLKLNA